MRRCCCTLFLSTLSLRRATCRLATRISRSFYFYPRSPCGERRFRFPLFISRVDFYPRSPCGERLLNSCLVLSRSLISIHALLAESDALPSSPYATPLISIHALLAESDTIIYIVCKVVLHFYPRSPCGERQRCIYLEYR